MAKISLVGFYSQKSPKIAHNLPANGSRYRLDRLLSRTKNL